MDSKCGAAFGYALNDQNRVLGVSSYVVREMMKTINLDERDRILSRPS